MLDDFPVISEIKTEYKETRAEGSGREETVRKLMQSYRNELGADDDASLFWIGLADAQIACKELSSSVAEKGLQALKTMEETEMAWLFGKKQIEKRKLQYSQPPMPERERIRIRKKFQCQWNIGDTFAYKLKGAEAEKYHLDGKYILLRKVDVVADSSGAIRPVVTLSLWDKTTLPRTKEEYQTVPPLKLDNGRMDSRVDQYEYRVELLIENNQQLKKMQLEYIGNYVNIPTPDNEVIFQRPGCVLMALPNKFDEECCIFYRRDRFYRTDTHRMNPKPSYMVSF